MELQIRFQAFSFPGGSGLHFGRLPVSAEKVGNLTHCESFELPLIAHKLLRVNMLSVATKLL